MEAQGVYSFATMKANQDDFIRDVNELHDIVVTLHGRLIMVVHATSSLDDAMVTALDFVDRGLSPQSSGDPRWISASTLWSETSKVTVERIRDNPAQLVIVTEDDELQRPMILLQSLVKGIESILIGKLMSSTAPFEPNGGSVALDDTFGKIYTSAEILAMLQAEKK